MSGNATNASDGWGFPKMPETSAAQSWDNSEMNKPEASDGWKDQEYSNQSTFEPTALSKGFDDLDLQDTVKNDTCRNCGLEGHFARECSQPRKMTCFNCGEDGHAKAECTEPRKFKGECRNCGEEDMCHPASQCPSKVEKVKACMNCFEEGHTALTCKMPKKFDLSNVADKTEPEAWELLKAASDDRDIDDFKAAIQIMSKAMPEYTYVSLEKEFRKRNFTVYLIAREKEHGDTWTNVDLQGHTRKKYAIGYYLSDKPQRPNLKATWPATPEENLTRLAEAGIPLDRGVDKCHNCEELGHIARNCPQEKIEREQPKISCVLCGEDGHRVRDCKEERPKPRGPKRNRKEDENSTPVDGNDENSTRGFKDSAEPFQEKSSDWDAAQSNTATGSISASNDWDMMGNANNMDRTNNNGKAEIADEPSTLGGISASRHNPINTTAW